MTAVRGTRRPGAGRGRLPVRLLLSCLALLAAAAAAPARADDSPRHAERGVQAYRAGKFELARVFFAHALQDAVLKGKEEWIVKATLNLADLELEAMEEREAERLLDGVGTRDPALRCLALWKRSQLAFLRRRHALAVSLADSALEMDGRAGRDKARALAVRADRLRYLIASRPPADWEKEYRELRPRLPGLDAGRAASLEASAAMARQDYARADSLWKAATAHYREQGRLAKVGACLNQQAMALFSRGLRAEALDANARAVAVFAELGLPMPGLRAQALRLLLAEDGDELARLRQDMDLVGQRYSGFDLQGILEEYSQSLPAAPPRTGP